MTNSRQIVRLVIADEQQIVREALRALVGSARDLDVVGEAQNGDDAVRLAARLLPDVVLIDVEMPGTDGVEATRRIRAAGTATAVVVLAANGDDVRIQDALHAGAIGFLLKDAPKPRLLSAIRRAALGGPTSVLSSRRGLA